MSPGTLKGKIAGMKHETDTQTIKCSAGQPHPHSWYLIIITGVLIHRKEHCIDFRFSYVTQYTRGEVTLLQKMSTAPWIIKIVSIGQ